MKLIEGMFGSEFGNHTEASKAFGLRTGQMRSRETIHNGGWYNAVGSKIGWGDLNPADYEVIQRNLDDGDVFVILSESDSFWSFVTGNPGVIGSMCSTTPDASAPGQAYVIDKARMLITKDRVAYVDRYVTDSGGFSEEEARALIVTAAKAYSERP